MRLAALVSQSSTQLSSSKENASSGGKLTPLGWQRSGMWSQADCYTSREGEPRGTHGSPGLAVWNQGVGGLESPTTTFPGEICHPGQAPKCGRSVKPQIFASLAKKHKNAITFRNFPAFKPQVYCHSRALLHRQARAGRCERGRQMRSDGEM
jgi:hypothetical protein